MDTSEENSAVPSSGRADAFVSPCGIPMISHYVANDVEILTSLDGGLNWSADYPPDLYYLSTVRYEIRCNLVQLKRSNPIKRWLFRNQIKDLQEIYAMVDRRITSRVREFHAAHEELYEE